MSADYKEKIRKLLSLAESPNEHEAKAALLKARQLMAEHKLTEAELEDAKNQEVRDILTGITCSKRRNPWIIQLSAIIGENYCCMAYRKHTKGKQTQRVGFVGFRDDAEICVSVFTYAVDCILAKAREIEQRNGYYGRTYAKRLSDSYGYGFAEGCKEAFQRQVQENEKMWGLVLAVPKEVQEYSESWGREQFQPRVAQKLETDAFSEGRRDGEKFDPHKRL